MADLPTKYAEEIKEGFKNYLATWVPQTRIALGDVGILNGKTFVGWSSLRAMGYPPSQFGASPWGVPAPMVFQSQDTTQIGFKTKAELAKIPGVPQIADLSFGAEIKFGKQGAVVFSAKDARVQRIDNVIALGKTILDLFYRGLWEEKWILVTEVVKAARATILISDSSNSSLVLKTKAKAMDIADLSANVSAVFSSGAQIRIVAEEGLTPLFRAVRVDDSWWSTNVKSVVFADPEQVSYTGMFKDVA
jgi:hypothetical protein